MLTATVPCSPSAAFIADSNSDSISLYYCSRYIKTFLTATSDVKQRRALEENLAVVGVKGCREKKI